MHAAAKVRAAGRAATSATSETVRGGVEAAEDRDRLGVVEAVQEGSPLVQAEAPCEAEAVEQPRDAAVPHRDVAAPARTRALHTAAPLECDQLDPPPHDEADESRRGCRERGCCLCGSQHSLLLVDAPARQGP